MNNIAKGYVAIPKYSLKFLIKSYGVAEGALYFLVQYDILKFFIFYIFSNIKNKILCLIVATLFCILPNSIEKWISFKFLLFDYVPRLSCFWNEIFSYPFIIFQICGEYHCFVYSDMRAVTITLCLFSMIIALLYLVPTLEKEYICFESNWKEWIKIKISDAYKNDIEEDFSISIGDVIKAVFNKLLNTMRLIVVLNLVVALYVLW